MHIARGAVGLVVAGLLVSGCTGSGADSAAGGRADSAPSGGGTAQAAGAQAAAQPVPDAGSFRDGTCRAAAPDVVTLPAAVRRLGRGPDVPEPALRELSTTQDRLRVYQEAAEAALRPVLDQLVVAIGLARIRAVSGTYERGLGDGVSAAYARVLEVCTG